MVIQDGNNFKVDISWNDSYKDFPYWSEPFNDPAAIARWKASGYTHNYTGEMYDMRMAMPIWNQYIIKCFHDAEWQDISTSYYKMKTGTVLPEHQDTYKKYVELFNLQGQKQNIRRAVIFLEDWKSGHYMEVDGRPLVNWCAGDGIMWNYDMRHMAANIGLEDRYTLQITGHVDG